MRRRALLSVSKPQAVIDINKYLTIEALQNGLTASMDMSVSYGKAIEYCIDGDGNWMAIASKEATKAINKGQTISFRNDLVATNNGIGVFTINGKCNLKGTPLSLMYGDNEAGNTTLVRGCFKNLFKNCTTIISAYELQLPSTTLIRECYYGMFYGCSNMIYAPILPALQLATDCYNTLFYNCTKLRYIKATFSTTPSSSYTARWVDGVGSYGVFIKRSNASWNVTGANGVPTDWMAYKEGQEPAPIEATLKGGDNGNIGIDVFNAIMNGYRDSFGNWYPMPYDKIVIVGRMGGMYTKAATVTSAFIDPFMPDFIELHYTVDGEEMAASFNDDGSITIW